jgi:hypothetical protein
LIFSQAILFKKSSEEVTDRKQGFQKETSSCWSKAEGVGGGPDLA